MRVRHTPTPVCENCRAGDCSDCELIVIDDDTDNYSPCLCTCGKGAETWAVL